MTKACYPILYEISFFCFVFQLLQAAGAIQKYMYYSFVVSLSAINDTFLSTNYNDTYIYQFISLFLVKTDISVIVKP